MKIIAMAAGVGFGLVDQSIAQQASQTAPDLVERATSQYEFNVSIGAWVPRAGGEVRLGQTSPRLSLEFDFDLDSSDTVPNVELSMRKNDRWELGLSGFDFSTESSGAFPLDATFGSLTLAAGDPFEASLDMTSFAMELAYWPESWHPYSLHVDGSSVDLKFFWGGGIRHIDIDQRVSLLTPGGGEQEASGEWMVPYAALGMEMLHPLRKPLPFLKAVRVEGQIGIGPALGGDGGFMAQVQAGLGFMINPNLAFTFAYRLIDMSVENDGYEFQGGLQGLFFAGSLRF
ncbi:MAG: hypothetical protein L0Y42_04640 [Phycisphaerales bacterium]|nr:hypothetical protein [Phycisphaerales bacterium]